MNCIHVYFIRKLWVSKTIKEDSYCVNESIEARDSVPSTKPSLISLTYTLHVTSRSLI